MANTHSTANFERDELLRDIDAILWSMRLYDKRRFFRQRFWETETIEAEHAARIEGLPRLESVADHSWHLCDIVLLLSDRFPDLNVERCLSMAVLHDKLEIITGDRSPLGRDGTGANTHAFNPVKQHSRREEESLALESYLSRLSPATSERQRRIFLELFELKSQESLFIKALDKLQPIAFILLKKEGFLVDSHLTFTLQYSKKAIAYFPRLSQHYEVLAQRLLEQVARRRTCSVSDLERIVSHNQLILPLSGGER